MNPREQNLLADEICELAGKIFDGSASQAEHDLLEKRLMDAPEARDVYLKFALLNAHLNLAGAVQMPRSDSGVLRNPIAVRSDFLSRRSRRIAAWGVSSLAVVLLAVGSLWLAIARPGPEPEVPMAAGPLPKSTEPKLHQTVDIVYYDDYEPPMTAVATSTNSAPLSVTPTKKELFPSTTLNVLQGMESFASPEGANIEVMGPALFGLSSPVAGVLFGGSVKARMTTPESTYAVQASDLKVVDLGTEFRMTAVDEDHVLVEVLDGEVEIQARHRLPLYYWNFDADAAQPADAVVGERCSLGQGVQVVDGIIGQHALRFDNSPAAFARVNGGTGETTGTGRFACSSGITIEAMIISHWTASELDYDEIFRKDDGISRVLLSFQNDGDRYHYSVPQVGTGPCLSFGLQLEGTGYSELEILLDGKEGHPSLEELVDGKPHHLVATYDSFTGRKSIYIDGQLKAQHQFASGAMIRSGGSQPAFIGSVEQREPFRGIIDEVAYYDFALTNEEIMHHAQRVQRGETYFEFAFEKLRAPQWEAVTRMMQGQTAIFNRHTATLLLLPQVRVQKLDQETR